MPVGTRDANRRRPSIAVDGRHHRLDGQHLGPGDVADERPHVVVGRCSDDLGRRADLHEAPVAHDGDAVAEAQRLDEVVGDEDHRRGHLAAEADDLVLHVPADDGIEGRERLVEQQQLRARGQRPGQADALLHPARQLVGAGRAEPRQADELEHLLGPGPAGVLVDALHLEAEGHVVDEVAVGEQAEVLEDHAHPVPAQVEQVALVGGGDVEVADAHGPGGRLDEPGQAAHERRLAAPGEAHDDEHLALVDVEVDARERRRRCRTVPPARA